MQNVPLEDAPEPTGDHAAKDIRTTLRNTLKLGGSMVLTIVIGFGVRLALRRYLGPTVIGPLNFADALTSMCFIFLGLGVDTYVRTVVPVDPKAANRFVGAFVVVRTLLAIAIFIGLALFLSLTDQPADVQVLVYVYGLAAYFQSLNTTFAAILHSTRTIDGLSILSVINKVLWAAGFVGTMIFGLPIVGIPISILATQLVALIVSYYLAKKHAGFELSFNFDQVKPVFFASLPFYLNIVAHTVYAKLDISWLKLRSTDEEIGLYSAASELAGMTFILAPMFGSVLMPLFVRAYQRSADEFTQVLRRSLEIILTFAVPASLAISLGADVWVQLFLGDQYHNAVLSLRIYGTIFVLTYMAMAGSIALTVTGKGWAATYTSIGGMIVNPILVLVLVPLFAKLGAGGAGAGCSVAQVATEVIVTASMLWSIEQSAFDARSVSMLLRSLLVCCVVVAIDQFALSGLGPLRLAIEALLYVALAVAIGAVHVRETVAFAKANFRRKAG